MDAPARRGQLAARARDDFAAAYGHAPAVIALAPGRVNLIGEHTDYNDGLVMPIAIDAWCACAASAAESGETGGRARDARDAEGRETKGREPGGRQTEGRGTEVLALDIGERRRLASAWPAGPDERDAEGRAVPRGHWMSYVGGVLHGVAAGRGGLPSLRLALTTNIPIGGGLSSSAALEVSVALAAMRVWGLAEPVPLEVARLCQRAEHEFAGVPCGLMDQCASILGRRGHAMLLDCRTMEHRHVRLSSDAAVVVVDTGVRHALAAGEYARRRAECAAACRVLGVGSLRDAGMRDVVLGAPIAADAAGAGGTGAGADVAGVLRRAHHVVSENGRVGAFAAMLEMGDLRGAGRLMQESHASLRDQYEVSCAELDRAVEGLSAMAGVLGARMTGGGFGGCAIALVEAGKAQGVVEEALRARLGVSARVVHAADGAAVIDW